MLTNNRIRFLLCVNAVCRQEMLEKLADKFERKVIIVQQLYF